jgi:hypothetical protein
MATTRQQIGDGAALALVGWYLMLLPKNQGIQVFDLPWSDTLRSFDTANECEVARDKAVVPPEPRAATVEKPAWFFYP